ncbi:MAG: S41 family peptidase [Acidobacteriota bacterium]
MVRSSVCLSQIAVCVLALASAPVGQQPPAAQPERAITAEERLAVIQGALERLNTAYVYPDVAKKMEEDIRARLARKEYERITSASALAETLTADLQRVSRDKHLRVVYRADGFPDERDQPSPEGRARLVEEERRRNFGFERVERLPGNVGYLDLRSFSGLPEAGETGVATMNFLANADALIIDLRQNGGGSPAMIGLISGYLFDDVVHLNDFYWRESDETRQFWTSPHVQGRRFGESKPVYVLTSNRTFSAAEEFTYNLKNLKRATIVGETTGGGAHPGGPRRINEHFAVWVPAGRAINPITKTDWEGTGIEPHVKVEARLALKTAHLDALKKLQADTTDARRKELLGRAIEQVQKELDELKGTKATV